MTSRPAGARSAIAAFFLADDSATNLAVARIAICVAVLRAARYDYLVTPATLPHELIRIPILMGWLQALIPATPEHVATLLWVVRIAAFCGALGLVTRVSTAVMAVGVLFLFVVPNSYGHVAHVHHHLAWFTALLATSRCGDALGLDAWWRRRRGGAAPEHASCYGFPLRAMAVVLGASYFCTGFWKVAVGGLQWVFSGNLAYLASKQAFIANGADPSFGPDLIGPVGAIPWPEMLTARHVVEPPHWLGALGGFFTIVFEMGFIAAITTRVGRFAAFLAGIGFHNFTRIFAGIGFDELLICYPFLLDVDAIGRWLAARLGHPLAPEHRRDTPPSPLLIATAAALIVGTFTLGALRIGAAWPVSCAPRFDVVHGPLFTSYVVSGVRPDGTQVHVRDGGLGGPALGRRLREIFRARQYHVPGTEEPDGRVRRWQVLCAYVWNHHPSLVDATDVRFTLVDVDLADGSAHPRVLGERELFHCDRADDPGPQ